MSETRRVAGVAAELSPNAVNESQETNLRTTKLGDLFTQPLGKPRAGLAVEGAYFVAVNATPGTGLAGIAAANGYDATEALAYIRNNGTKNIVLDFIKLQTTVAGTNGTDVRFDCHVDSVARYTSGGTELSPKNVKMNGAGSGAQIYVGALVTPAAGADVVRVGGGELRSVITVVGDQYVFDFGGDPAQGTGAPANGLLAAVIKTAVAPIVLTPGDSFLLAVNAASQTVGSSYEVEIGYFER